MKKRFAILFIFSFGLMSFGHSMQKPQPTKKPQPISNPKKVCIEDLTTSQIKSLIRLLFQTKMQNLAKKLYEINRTIRQSPTPKQKEKILKQDVLLPRTLSADQILDFKKYSDLKKLYKELLKKITQRAQKEENEFVFPFIDFSDSEED